MVKDNLQIVWTKRAQSHLKQIFDYISEESEQVAIKVISDLAIAVGNTAKHPEKHKIDQYKENNDGTYRAFEMHHFRVSYRNENRIIRILRIRHTKMNPKKY